jgi:hypothetical protein
MWQQDAVFVDNANIEIGHQDEHALCRNTAIAGAYRRAFSVAVRDARQRWWRCDRGSRQRSS